VTADEAETVGHTVESEPVSLYGSDTPEDALCKAFTGGDVPVAVYGLGKMGLPLAAVYGDVTGNVTGVDIDQRVVASVNAGGSPVNDEPGLPELVGRLTDEGTLTATTDSLRAATNATVHVVIVPTLVAEDEPDLSALEAAIRDIGAGLDSGDLVVIESTVPPRTCRDRVIPWLETESSLELGDFGVAFCPERTMSGRALKDIRGAHPKVVGGADNASRRAAKLVYGSITDAEVLSVADCTTAECVKVFEGVYRDVNIALANELGRMADNLGVDVMAASETANTQPYCDIHSPGPGVGGHCIPYYPYFLMAEFDNETPLLATARDVNDDMPAFTVETLADDLADTGQSLADSSVLIMGLTYRPGVDETRKSPGVDVASLLANRADTAYAVDPVCTSPPPSGVKRVAIDDVPDLNPDGIVLTTAHEAFQSLPKRTFQGAVVVDGHRVLDVGDVARSITAIGDGS